MDKRQIHFENEDIHLVNVYKDAQHQYSSDKFLLKVQ